MAKAVLEFDLSNFDDKTEFERMVKAEDMANALWEILLNGRKKLIRQLEADELSTEREFDVVDKVFEHIWEIAKDHNIDIEAMIS